MTKRREPPFEAQIAARLEEIRRAEQDDPFAGIALAAYFAQRATLFRDEVRSFALDQLQPWLDAASDEARSTAERYSELRTTFAEVERQHASPPLAPERIARQVRRARSMHLAARTVSVLSWVGLPLGGVGFLIRNSQPTPGSALMWVGWGLFSLRALRLSYLVHDTGTAAVLVETRSEEMHARWRAWRTLVERRDAIVDGTEGRWLHALIEKHPALEFPERTRRR